MLRYIIISSIWKWLSNTSFIKTLWSSLNKGIVEIGGRTAVSAINHYWDAQNREMPLNLQFPINVTLSSKESQLPRFHRNLPVRENNTTIKCLKKEPRLERI